MLSKILAKQIYCGDYGWHVGRFHFSFADYDDPGNTGFGDLLTFNDFTLQPGSGFDPHPHEEIEIISYCLEGQLVHEDDMGNQETIEPGEMQYTCAGSGIIHSERNGSLSKPLRFIQIWIRPNAPRLAPGYRAVHFSRADRLNRLLQIASGDSMENTPCINQDANIFISEIQAGRRLDQQTIPGRQVYLACLDGALRVNDLSLACGDAVKIWDEPALDLSAVQVSQMLMVEMPRILN